MSRVGRALGRANFDAYLRAEGFRGEAHAMELARLHARLDAGGRVTADDIERLHVYYPAIPRDVFNRIADHINGGQSGRERADRCADAVYGRINPASGIPVEATTMRDKARVVAQTMVMREFSDSVAGRLNDRDAHRDRHAGIDEKARAAEQARRAAMNPANERHADIARAVRQHDPQPTWYAAERRELLAQASERIGERDVKRHVRDSDPNRDPMRGDDRRADIALEFDRAMVNGAAHEELAVAANPVLERVDDAITFEEAQHDATR